MRSPRRKPELALTLLLALAVAAPVALAQSAEEKGLAIAREVDARDRGFGDFTASMTMLLRNKQGDESLRNIRLRTLEVQGDGDKSMSVFDEPADVRGTAFLTHSHATKPDDQWLYLPALKRVKRISSKNKSGPFMGSEFAYEDLTSQEVEKYRYRWLRDEVLDGRETMVLERVPAYEHSGYTRQVVWVDRIMWQPLKVEYYDRKQTLLKTLELGEYRQYLDRYWRALRMHMRNHQTGKSTQLEWRDLAFRTGLDERDFDHSALRRVR